LRININFVFEKAFKAFMAVVCLQFKMPSPSHFKLVLLPAIYNLVCANIMVELNPTQGIEFVACTTDGWSAGNTLGCILFDFYYNNVCLTMIEGVLQEWEIASRLTGMLLFALEMHLTYLLVIVLDTTNVNGALLRIGGWNGWYCFAHILQLVICDGIDLDNVKNIIDGVRAGVTFFKLSTNATYELLDAQKKKGMGVGVVIVGVGVVIVGVVIVGVVVVSVVVVSVVVVSVVVISVVVVGVVIVGIMVVVFNVDIRC
jgi:hypothetical protein